MASLTGVFQPLQRLWNRIHRRSLTGFPRNTPPEADIAYRDPQFRYYATAQPYSSPLTLAFGNLTGETWEMRQAYREWAIAEPAVKMSLLTKCLQVAQLDPVVRPADKTNPRDVEAAAWVKYAITQSEDGWPGLINNITFPGCMDGFSVVEKINDTIHQPGRQYHRFWYHSRYPSLDTHFIRFRLDTFRRITAVQSSTGQAGGMAIDPRDFVIFTHLKVFENPFGNSDLRAVVRAARIIESAIRLRHILLTNFSGPYIVAKTKDPGSRNLFLKILGDARSRGFIVCDPNDDVEVINLATAAPDQFADCIQDQRKEIVGAISGAYLHLLEGDVSDGTGNTQVHKDISQLFVWWLAIWVSQAINRQIVPDLVIPNYGYDVGMPVVSLGGVDYAVIIQALQMFTAARDLIDISAEQVRETCSLEVPKDEMDTIKAAWRMPQANGGGPNPPNPFDLKDFDSDNGAHRGHDDLTPDRIAAFAKALRQKVGPDQARDADRIRESMKSNSA